MSSLKVHARLPIRSENRTKSTETSSKFTWKTKTPINFTQKATGGRGQWQYFCRAEKVVIPNTFYNVNSTNNTLSVTETGGSYTAQIGSGNYDVASFITALKAELETESLANGDGNTFTIVKDDITGKFTFSYSGASATVQFNDSGSTMFGVLGLTTGTNHSFTVASPLIGQQVGFQNKIRMLAIRLGGDVSVSNYFGNNSNPNVITQVPVISDSFTDIYYPNDSTHSDIIRLGATNSASSFNIELVDEDDRVVDLNGEEWSFTLAFYKELGN